MNHEQLADRAEALITAAIREPRIRLRHELAQLEPLEAMALLGFLADDTIVRFPPDERASILAAFTAALQDSPPDA